MMQSEMIMILNGDLHVKLVLSKLLISFFLRSRTDIQEASVTFMVSGFLSLVMYISIREAYPEYRAMCCSDITEESVVAIVAKFTNGV